MARKTTIKFNQEIHESSIKGNYGRKLAKLLTNLGLLGFSQNEEPSAGFEPTTSTLLGWRTANYAMTAFVAMSD